MLPGDLESVVVDGEIRYLHRGCDCDAVHYSECDCRDAVWFMRVER